MRTLIIPCADGRKIQGNPLSMARHPAGELLMERVMRGIHPEEYDRIIIAVLQREGQEIHLKDIYKNQSCENHVVPEFVFLPEITNGPADTVYETIKIAKIYGEMAVKDAVSSIDVELTNAKNFIAGVNLSDWKEDVHDIRRKSFIVLNENDQVLDIVEKQIKSENISVGFYGFHEANDFLFAYERLSDTNYPVKALYVSHIISYLIGYKEKVFHYLPASRFEEWGNEKAWLELQKRFGTYFLDLDMLFWEKPNNCANDNIMNLLRILSEKGAVFVGFTTQDVNTKNKTKKLFSEWGINCLQVVYGTSVSTVKRILSDENEVSRCLYEI